MPNYFFCGGRKSEQMAGQAALSQDEEWLIG